jgi:hypothetical protein
MSWRRRRNDRRAAAPGRLTCRLRHYSDVTRVMEVETVAFAALVAPGRGSPYSPGPSMRAPAIAGEYGFPATLAEPASRNPIQPCRLHERVRARRRAPHPRGSRAEAECRRSTREQRALRVRYMRAHPSRRRIGSDKCPWSATMGASRPGAHNAAMQQRLRQGAQKICGDHPGSGVGGGPMARARATCGRPPEPPHRRRRLPGED